MSVQSSTLLGVRSLRLDAVGRPIPGTGTDSAIDMVAVGRAIAERQLTAADYQVAVRVALEDADRQRRRADRLQAALDQCDEAGARLGERMVQVNESLAALERGMAADAVTKRQLEANLAVALRHRDQVMAESVERWDELVRLVERLTAGLHRRDPRFWSSRLGRDVRALTGLARPGAAV